jgi:hypothetical protein
LRRNTSWVFRAAIFASTGFQIISEIGSKLAELLRQLQTRPPVGKMPAQVVFTLSKTGGFHMLRLLAASAMVALFSSAALAEQDQTNTGSVTSSITSDLTRGAHISSVLADIIPNDPVRGARGAYVRSAIDTLPPNPIKDVFPGPGEE